MTPEFQPFAPDPAQGYTDQLIGAKAKGKPSKLPLVKYKRPPEAVRKALTGFAEERGKKK